MGGTKIEEDNLKRDTLLFDLIKRRYDAEWDKIAGLDSKANNFIVSVVTGLLLGSSTFTFSKLLSYPSLTVLYFLGTGLLLVSIGFALSAIKIRRWHTVLNVETLLNKYTSMSYWDAFITNRDTMADAVKQNI